MPKKMERKLKARARKKFPGSKERQDRYVYGTLRKTGWKPSKHHSAPVGEFMEKLAKKFGVSL